MKLSEKVFMVIGFVLAFILMYAYSLSGELAMKFAAQGIVLITLFFGGIILIERKIL